MYSESNVTTTGYIMSKHNYDTLISNYMYKYTNNCERFIDMAFLFNHYYLSCDTIYFF
jgi:hypothetical protein